MNSLLETPDEVAGTQEVLSVVYGQGSEDPFDELREYLEETGVQNISREMMTEENLPYIAWDELGTPLLHGDDKLEEQLNLPDDVQAILSSNGVVHKMFTPGMHGIENHNAISVP